MRLSWADLLCWCLSFMSQHVNHTINEMAELDQHVFRFQSPETYKVSEVSITQIARPVHWSGDLTSDIRRGEQPCWL